MTFCKFITACLGFLILASCGGGNESKLSGEKVVPKPSPRDGGSANERQMAALIRGHSGQKRAQFNWDPKLAESARRRAQDMGRRNYFSHTDPDGHGPDWHVTRAGYKLPIKWTAFKGTNHVESILGGYRSANEAFTYWLRSPEHLRHLLGRKLFYENQTNFGIGYAHVPGSTYVHYWVLHTAPPEL